MLSDTSVDTYLDMLLAAFVVIQRANPRTHSNGTSTHCVLRCRTWFSRSAARNMERDTTQWYTPLTNHGDSLADSVSNRLVPRATSVSTEIAS